MLFGEEDAKRLMMIMKQEDGRGCLEVWIACYKGGRTSRWLSTESASTITMTQGLLGLASLLWFARFSQWHQQFEDTLSFLHT
jgi:hypothetical protein